MSGGRAGLSLPEAIVAMLLGFFVVQLGLSTAQQLRAARLRLSARSDALVTLRVGRHVLRSELRRGRPVTDWTLGDDSISVRAFRGTALVCPYDTTSTELTVAYSGERAPAPAKDSVLLFTASGQERALSLTAVATGSSCGSAGVSVPPGRQLATWRLSTPVAPGAVLGRLYERGSYHVSGSAVRYRRGASGRQPLTPASLSAASGIEATPGGVELELSPRDSTAVTPWVGSLAWSPGP